MKKYNTVLYGERYRKKNKEKIQLKYSTLEKSRRATVFSILGEQCVKCGFSDKRALQIDHIHGNGKEERNTNGAAFYKKVLTSLYAKQEKYQILCANCNWIKRYENKEWEKYRQPNENYKICQQNQKHLTFPNL